MLLVDGCRVLCPAKRYVCARAEVAAFARQNGNVDIIALGDLLHGEGKLVVGCSVEGVEFLGCIERDDGDFAAVLELDGAFGGHGGGAERRRFGEMW